MGWIAAENLVEIIRCGSNVSLKFSPLKKDLSHNRKRGLTIDYNKAYADILHKQILDCESGEISDGQLVNSVYKQYMRIKYIEEKMKEFIYEKPLDTSIFTLWVGVNSSGKNKWLLCNHLFL